MAKELIFSAGGRGLRGTFTHAGGWGRQRQPLDIAESLEPQNAPEQERSIV